jgi:hypothetical protein
MMSSRVPFLRTSQRGSGPSPVKSAPAFQLTPSEPTRLMSAELIDFSARTLRDSPLTGNTLVSGTGLASAAPNMRLFWTIH